VGVSVGAAEDVLLGLPEQADIPAISRAIMISKENFRTIIFPMDVGYLLFILLLEIKPYN
jgi:hypothetical protein